MTKKQSNYCPQRFLPSGTLQELHSADSIHQLITLNHPDKTSFFCKSHSWSPDSGNCSLLFSYSGLYIIDYHCVVVMCYSVYPHVSSSFTRFTAFLCSFQHTFTYTQRTYLNENAWVYHMRSRVIKIGGVYFYFHAKTCASVDY